MRQWYGVCVGEEAVALVTMALTHDHDVLSGTKHPTLYHTVPPTHPPTYLICSQDVDEPTLEQCPQPGLVAARSIEAQGLLDRWS